MTWVQTAHGMRFDFLAPTAKMVSLVDVAHHLARICRFNGAVRGYWSVASHSVMVADVAASLAKSRGLDEMQAGYRGLLHDAAEAYTGDIVRPLKDLLPEFRKIEERVEAVVDEYFGIKASNDAIAQVVKRADNILLATEARDFLPKYADKYIHGVEPLEKRLVTTTREIAESQFLSAFSYWAAATTKEVRESIRGAA